MTIIFHIHYHTTDNQQLYIVGSIPELGDGRWEQAAPMEYEGNGNWKLSIQTSVTEISYNYVIMGDEVIINEPWKRKHTIKPDADQPVCYLYDFWALVPNDAVLYTSAFTQNLFARHDDAKLVENAEYQSIRSKSSELIIRVLCPHVERHQLLCISGNCKELGHWNPAKAPEMYCLNFPEWEIRLNMKAVAFPLEYKFFITADDKEQNICWESGENRIIQGLPEVSDADFVIADYPFRDVRPKWKGAGTVIPVFSLRSKQSFGIGDLHDLKLLIDWAKMTNQRLIQVLPLNDTTSTCTWTDSYPYNAISTDALHPVYISLSEMGKLKDKKLSSIYRQHQTRLNKAKEVNYDEVLKQKISYCRAYFDQEKTQLLEDKTFKSFLQTHWTWLEPYAAFCYYRDKYQTASFTTWKNGDATYNPQRIKQLFETQEEAKEEMLFTCFLQFVLHTQFKAASDYARNQGIILKGDLPIGISRTSVEAWMEASLFNCDMQAGAPPDLFSTTGQNWGFPTYNWEEMEKDKFAWWKKRFRNLSVYFDCLRIDHILGFFRIWEIPMEYIQGLCGHFRPALPMTVDEIEQFGFKFDKRYVKHQIHAGFLNELFGELATEVIKKNLKKLNSKYFTLQSFCNTQRKIEHFFSDAVALKNFYTPTAFDQLEIIKDGLLKISSEILFIEDPYEKNKYHTRIQASQTYAFQELSEKDKTAFQQLSDHFFYERHTEFWKTVALKRLTPLVNCTEMLICGEDLGMIPKSVHEVMDELHILSLELERTPKVDSEEFTPLQSVPYLSVCTTSTHDMEPLRSWWKENPQQTQRYYQSVLHQDGSATPRLDAEVAEQIIINHLNASSMLTIIPLQDWFTLCDTFRRTDGQSERINIPDHPQHYWNYRMHLTIEQLMQAHDWNQKIRELIAKSGR